MGRLFKQYITRYRMPDGRPVPKGTPGARKCKERSEKWYGEYRTASDELVRKPLARDKAAASTMLNDRELKAERTKSGRCDQFDEHNRQSLAEHIEAFGRSLTAKGNTTAHVTGTLAKLQTMLGGCDFRRLSDLSAARLADFLAKARQCGLPADALAEPPAARVKSYAKLAKAFGVGVATVKYWRRQRAPIKPRGENDPLAVHRWRIEYGCQPMGVATSNHYLTAAKAFGAWLVRDRRWPENPFGHLSALNAEVDLRRERRALSADEFGRLVEAARVGQAFRGMGGPDRALLYIVAANTGLRAAELASLTADSFDLEANPPTVTVEAGYSKHRRRDVLPLRSDLVGRLCPLLSRFDSEAAGLRENRPRLVVESEAVRPRKRSAAAKLWPGTWHKRAATMLRLDLEAAGVAAVDASGRVFDFHALRHQFLSDLARVGVHPKEAQALARHSTITLTMDRYTHLGIFDLTSALDRLPALPLVDGPQAGTLRATGTTDDRPDAKPSAAVDVSRENFVTGFVTGPVTVSPVRPCPALSENVQVGERATERENARTPEEIEGFSQYVPQVFQVDRGGIEPPTHGFSVHCSTN